MDRGARRWAAIALGIALVSAACSSTEEGSSNTNPSTAAELPIEAIGPAAVSYVRDLGDEGAFAAVLVALDRGYGPDQLVPAVDLRADGTIRGVEPAHEPQGLIDYSVQTTDAVEASTRGRSFSQRFALRTPTQIDEPDATAGAEADEFNPLNAALLGLDLTVGEAHRIAAGQAYLDEMRLAAPEVSFDDPPEATKRDYLAVMGLISLAVRGYSAEQIVLGMMAGEIIVDIPPDPACVRIMGVTPALSGDGLAGVCPAPGKSSNATTLEADDEESPGDGPDDDQGDAGPEDIVSTWSGEIIPSSPPLQRMDRAVDGYVAIDQYGDGTYTIEAYVEFEFDTGIIGGTCTTLARRSTSATATPSDPSIEFRFEGTDSWDELDSDCPVNPYSDEINTGWPVLIEGDTATGMCCGGMDYTVTKEP